MESLAMSRYNFTSPGAAAGEGIVNILAQRRAEARQKMIDEIDRQNSESARRLQQEQLTASQQRRELEQLGAQTESMPYDAEVTPATPGFDLMRKYNRLQPKPTASVSTSESFTPAEGQEGMEFEQQPGAGLPQEPMPVGPDTPVRYGYAGTREDQERNRANREISALLERHPDMSDEAKQAVEFAMASGDLSSLGAGFWQTFKQGKGRIIYDSDSGTWQELPDGITDVTVIPRTPQGPRDTMQDLGPARDEAGNEIKGKRVVIQNGQLTVVDLPKGIGDIAPKPSPTSAKTEPLISDADWRLIADLASRTDAQSQREAANLTRNKVASAPVSDPNIREAVLVVMDGFNPLTQKPLTDADTAETLTDEMEAVEGVTQEELDQYFELLTFAGR